MNVVILSGNLTKDPELKFTPKGHAVCEFTIANNKKWKTELGEQKERVAFISCVMWGNRGEAFAKYHKKGAKAMVRGELVQESWDDKETGKKQTKTRVQAEEWEFVGGRESDAPQSQASAPKASQPAQQTPKPAAWESGDDSNSDAPF
jgi:single-strand DNA-binding protein